MAKSNSKPTVAALRAQVTRLRARLARAAPRIDTVVQELDVYREETRQQTEQLLDAQRTLEDSRDRYASLYDLAPIGYVTLDYNGTIREINLLAAAMLGAERPWLLHMPMLVFVVPDDRQAYLRHLIACRRTAAPVATELRLAPRPGGREIPVQLRSFSTPRRVGAADGKGFEFRSALIDLTERRLAEQHEAEYRRRLRSLASELSLAEERERRRIAVEIHDNISQALAMAKMRLDAACRRVQPPEVAADLCELSGVINEVLGQTRSLTFELSPPVLYELGFVPALEWLAERAEKQYRIKVTVDAPAETPALPQDTAVMLFQAVRELLVNVSKHARATRVKVRVRQNNGWIHLVVDDDGVGFKPDPHPPHTNGDGQPKVDAGFGLFSIRARLEHVGGTLAFTDTRGRGSRVTLTVPTSPQSGTPTAPPPADAAPDLDGLGGSPRPDDSRTLPASLPEGPDHESTARRRPPHREGRPPQPHPGPAGP